jgi:hypothetical protein
MSVRVQDSAAALLLRSCGIPVSDRGEWTLHVPVSESLALMPVTDLADLAGALRAVMRPGRVSGPVVLSLPGRSSIPGRPWIPVRTESEERYWQRQRSRGVLHGPHSLVVSGVALRLVEEKPEDYVVLYPPPRFKVGYRRWYAIEPPLFSMEQSPADESA